MSSRLSNTLDVHLRAFAERTGTASRRPGRYGGLRRPGWMPAPGERDVLVLDVETTIDTRQRLTFGVWRLCREILDSRGGFERLAVREEGIVYADDLPERNPAGFAVLQEYVQAEAPSLDPERHRIEPVMDCALELVLAPRSWFVEERLFKIAYKRKAPVVGFNLKFDLSRLAAGWAPSRRGGFSLYTHTIPGEPSKRGRPGRRRHHPYRPTIHVKPIDGRGALICFGSRRSPDPGDADSRGRSWQGEFTDLYSLVLGLTGAKHSLRSAGEAMGCETLKVEAEEHGEITPEYIGYARQDVAATHELYEHARLELERHPIDLPPHRVLSSASVGKAYKLAMGDLPRLARQPDFDRSLLGAATSSYYGGLVQALLTGVSPIRYYDVLSMYPTSNALLGLWDLDTAERVGAVDATDEVRALLESITAEELLEHPERWREFRCIARLGPVDLERRPGPAAALQLYAGDPAHRP